MNFTTTLLFAVGLSAGLALGSEQGPPPIPDVSATRLGGGYAQMKDGKPVPVAKGPVFTAASAEELKELLDAWIAGCQT